MVNPPPESQVMVPHAGGLGGLEMAIVQAEARLIARQQGLRQKIHGLQDAARESVRPGRLLAPLLGAGMVSTLVWWLLRGRSPGRSVSQSGSQAAWSAGGIPWADLLMLAWPMLPARLRGRVSPATALAIVSVAMPLWHGLRGKHVEENGPSTVVAVDLTRFAGAWYEIARIPAPKLGNARGMRLSHFTLRTPTPGANEAAVFDLVETTVGAGGEQRSEDGIAQVVADSGGARLKISSFPIWLRWLPLAWADHWILYLDEGYTLALVGSPQRDALRVLARRPEVDESDLAALVALARDEGYVVDDLHITGTHRASQ